MNANVKIQKTDDAYEEEDPVLVLIGAQRRNEARLRKAYINLDEMESKAHATHGLPPIKLIAWRNYSAIGGSEIDRTYRWFKEDGVADEQVLNREYADAKKRYASVCQEFRKWHRRAGSAGILAEIGQLEKDIRGSDRAIWRTKPTTVAGATALLDFAAELLAEYGDERSGAMRAIKNCSTFFKQQTDSGKATS